MRRSWRVDPGRIGGRARPLQRVFVFVGRGRSVGDPRILGQVLIGGLRHRRLLGHRRGDTRVRGRPSARPPARAAGGAGTSRSRRSSSASSGASETPPRREPRPAPPRARCARPARAAAMRTAATRPPDTKKRAPKPGLDGGRDEAQPGGAQPFELREVRRRPAPAPRCGRGGGRRPRSGGTPRGLEASRGAGASGPPEESMASSLSLAPCSARAASSARRRLRIGPQRGRRRGDHDPVAAPPEVEVAVWTRRARVRGGPLFADQAQLLERGLELGAEDAPLDALDRGESGLHRGTLPVVRK